MSYVRIDGGTSFPERSKRLSSFESTHNVSVLLISFGTGAVGYERLSPSNVPNPANSRNHRLNLACANQIHILEPQWNPMVEEQAIGRVLRLGQKREVTVFRYIMDGTIEEVGPRNADLESPNMA